MATELREQLRENLRQATQAAQKHSKDVQAAFIVLNNALLAFPSADYGPHPTYRQRALANSIEVSINNPQHLTYYDLKNDQLRHAKPYTVMRYLNRHLDLNLTDETLQICATIYGDHALKTDAFTFNIIEGDLIKDLYSNTPHTCMTGSASLNFYAENAPNIQAVHIQRGTDTIGRAILWTLIDDRRFLDRIYPSQGHHVPLLIKHAKRQGWITRVDHGASIGAPARDIITRENPITTVLKTARDDRHTTHAMGGFPYQDTFRLMKHSPNKTEVMLRYTPTPGWVTIGYVDQQYRNLVYCPLLAGWEHSANMQYGIVLDERGDFRPETRFSGAYLRRTHEIIRWPKAQTPPTRVLSRVYASTKDHNIVQDEYRGYKCLEEHSVKDADGKIIFMDDAVEMHDGTYQHINNLVHLARLPNGVFVNRRDATYDQETREWRLNE